MPQESNTQGYFFKTLFTSAALFAESIVLLSFLYNYSISGDFFTLDTRLLIYVSLLLLAICYTYALSVGSWNSWLQFVTVPLPISIANALIVIQINYLYAALVFFASYFFLSYDVFFATQIKEQLIKFNPRIILRFSTKGLLFNFAIMAGVLVFLSPVSVTHETFIDSVSDIAEQQTQTIISQSLNQSGVGENSQLGMLAGLGVANLDFKEIIQAQMRGFIEPYKHYITPIVSVLVIGTIQFLNSLVYLVFAGTISFVYGVAKKTGFLKVEYREVSQEVLVY